MIQISGGKSALWWEQKRQMRGGKSDKLGGGKIDKGKWTTTQSKLVKHDAGLTVHKAVMVAYIKSSMQR